MLAPDLPANEIERIAVLQRLQLLDTPADPVFDELVEYAASALNVRYALVSVVDAERQWFKASFNLDAQETGRNVSFCGHAILNPHDIMEVEDALLDTRFWDNPLVLYEPRIRFYAGCPIVLSSGHAIGTVCVIDPKPRVLNEEQRLILKALAQIAAGEIERQFPPVSAVIAH